MGTREEKTAPAGPQWGGGSDREHTTDFERASTGGSRGAAWVSWAAAIALQIVAVAIASGKLAVPVLGGAPLAVAVLAVVLCAVLAILGARFWRSARHAGGDRGEDGVGIAMSSLAFAPMAVFFATSRNATGRVKVVSAACAVAMIAILIVEWVL